MNLNELGFVNVKYVVPKMLTMTFGHQNRRIVKSRVEKAIAYKGRGYVDTEWMENPTSISIRRWMRMDQVFI